MIINHLTAPKFYDRSLGLINMANVKPTLEARNC